MSKIREHPDEHPGRSADGAETAEGDLRPYVIFTQLRAGGPHVYAGWLDAADDEMAVAFAREHYGQDQECVGLWAVPRRFVAGLRMNAEAAAESGPRRRYQLFVQTDADRPHESADVVEATCAAEALEAARGGAAAAMPGVWAVPCAEIVSTEPGDLIWRHTDQSYRLARGYSRSVREKWESVREQRALEDYERDDLQESF